MYYTDVKFRPKKVGSRYLVSSTQLPPMISSVESKLGLYTTNKPHPLPSKFPMGKK